MSLNIKVDTSQFQKNLNLYMKYTKRSLTEAVNQHAYYIARNAVNSTPAAKKEEIRNDLEAASRRYPSVPIAAILANQERKSKGKRGLWGAKMAKAVISFIKKRQASRNFLRAGWLPAVKKFQPIVRTKRGAPIPDGTKIKGQPKGGGKPARESIKPIFKIWNSVFGGKKQNSKVKEYIKKGAQIAVDQESKSMLEYVRKKMDETARKVGWNKK